MMGAAQPIESAPPRKLSLMEIVEHYQAVLDEIDAADGEVTEETGAKLDALGVSLEAKGEGYAAVIAMLEEHAVASRGLARRYAERAARKERQAKALKERLLAAMQATGKKKIETDTATIAIQKSPPSLNITGPVPRAYCKEPEPNASLIKEKLAEGLALDFAELITTNVHLRIR